MSGTKHGASQRKRNVGQFKPGESGNTKGRPAGKIRGALSKAIRELAKETAAEAFAIVQEIARHGENEGERLRAARIWLELAADVSGEDASLEGYRVEWVDEGWRAPGG
jgi:hypothetical protein